MGLKDQIYKGISRFLMNFFYKKRAKTISFDSLKITFLKNIIQNQHQRHLHLF
jgi:hypothetical protein